MTDSQKPGAAQTPFGVQAEIMREMRGFFYKVFAVGLALAAAAVTFYWKYSPSHDKIFHCCLIAAGAGFTFPMFTASVRLMVRMYYMNHASMQKSEEMIDGFREVKDDAKPIVADVRLIVHDIRKALEKYSNDDLVRSLITEVKKELDAEDGAVRKFTDKFSEAVDALKALTAPIGQPRRPGLLERGIRRDAAADPAPGAAAPRADGTAPDAKAETKKLETARATEGAR
jgi:hypothetical protein